MPSTSFLRTFAHVHDDLPAFHAAYLVITFLAATLLNLGVFGLLIVAHVGLDVVKYRERLGYSWRKTWEGAFRESLVDTVLLLTGLVFAVYLHHRMGLVVGISGVMRSEITIVRFLGITIPKIGILHHFCKVVVHLQTHLATPHPRMGLPYSPLENILLKMLTVAILLLLLAGPVLGRDAGTVLGIVWEQITH